MTTYEEKEKLREIVSAVAPFLGDWQLFYGNYRGIYLSSSDERELQFAFPWNKSDRLEIRGIFLNGLNNYLPYGDSKEKTKITVSVEKTPERIAQDIKKRLLPPYERMFAIAQKRKQENDQYKAKRRLAMEMVKEAIGGDVHFSEYREDELYGYRHPFKAKYWSGDKIEFTITLPLQKAIEVLKKI